MRILPWQRSGYQSCDTFLLAVSQLVRWILKPCVGTSDWSQWTWLRSHLEINKTFLLFLHAVCLLFLSSNARGKYQGDYFNLLSSFVLHHTHDSLTLCSEDEDDSRGVGLAALIHTYPPTWTSQYPGVWVKGDKMEASEGWVTTPQGHNLSLVCLLSQHTQQRENTLFTEDEGNSDHLTEHTLLCEASRGLPHIRKDGCQVK